MLGELLELDNRPELAALRWKEAQVIAKGLEDRELRFKTDLALFKQALRAQDHAVARSIRRRLLKMSPRVPSGIEEVAEFKRLSEEPF